MRRAILYVVVAALLALIAAAPANAQRQPYGTNDYGGFRSVLPPGTDGVFNVTDYTLFLANGTRPPHAADQLPMYRDLMYATPGLVSPQIGKYFKNATFGVQAGDEERTYSPRAGVIVVRDKGFGVPHVYGTTRADTLYGAGYVGAEDRLFFMDVLRHAGRGALSGFAGGANKAMDKEVWESSPYTEADLQKQVDQMDDLYGAEGAALQQDVANYVAGINKYIAEARLDATKLPAEYAAVGETLEDWKATDVIATAALVGGIFGKGGGAEVENADILSAARQRFGPTVGTQVWNDFRRNEDPEAPTTVRGTSFPYQADNNPNPAAVAKPDPGSLVDVGGASPSDSALAKSIIAPVGLLHGNSNALLVSGAASATGHPLAVIGPQVGYFMPQILIEQDLHGPDIDATGAAFAGVSPYVLLGHGQDYAWSATSAGQDIIDTFAEELCEPNGSPPTLQSTHYRYKGQCLEMETLTRTNDITPNPADPSPPETYTLTAQRTVHGIVHKRGTVGGKPVAFAKQRSTYFHEADSARGFAELNRPSKVKNVQDFQQAVSKIGFTFNWFYIDDKDIGYFNSGDNPQRADGVSYAVPNWGTGQWDWKNFNVANQTASYTPFAEHPRNVNQRLPDVVEQQAGARVRRVRLQLELQLGLSLAAARHADREPVVPRPQDDAARPDLGHGGRGHLGPARAGGGRLDAQGPGRPERPGDRRRHQDPGHLGLQGLAPDRPEQGRQLRRGARRPDHRRVVAARGGGHVQARAGRGSLQQDGRQGGHRQPSQQPRRPPRQRLAGRLVRVREQGPAPPARPERAGPALTRVLRQRQPGRVPSGAAVVTRRRAGGAEGAALHRQRLHRRGRDLLRRGALPRHRRRDGAPDPLDQPAHLSAGGAGELAPPALSRPRVTAGSKQRDQP